MFLGLFALSSMGKDAQHLKAVTKKRTKKSSYELTEAEATALRDRHEQLRRRRHGMKEFFFDGGSVWARNHINAQRKAKNLGYKPLFPQSVQG